MAEDDFGRLRLSDADRLHALNELGEHFAAGRIDSVEFDDLSGAAAAARTMSDMTVLFDGLPGGIPFGIVDGRIIQKSSSSPDEPGTALAETTSNSPDIPADKELQSLRKRGKMIESLDGAVFGVTLISFLVLQFVVGWSWAWVVWPTLAVTLTVPRIILNYGDEDEEIYEEIKEVESEARKKRLKRASERIRELEEGKDDDPGSYPPPADEK